MRGGCARSPEGKDDKDLLNGQAGCIVVGQKPRSLNNKHISQIICNVVELRALKKCKQGTPHYYARLKDIFASICSLETVDIIFDKC